MPRAFHGAFRTFAGAAPQAFFIRLATVATGIRCPRAGTCGKADKISAMAKPGKSVASSFSPEFSRDISDLSPNPSKKSAQEFSLADHFLIAMPSMLDPVFGGTVVYLCEHNENGALGVIINKPTDMTMEVLFDRVDLKLEIAPRSDYEKRPVMFGGPVQIERGFVLHSPSAQYSSMISVSEEIAMTTSKDVLEEVAAGRGPQRILVSLGCAGWSAGQLEQEIARNGWLTVPADPDIVFDLPIEERFVASMKLLGIDPSMLAGQAGHA
jgi:putative transcriptional regulator